MTFNSLENILGSLAQRTLAPHQQDYQRLVESWERAVGPKVSKYTRPLSVERGVLKVATSSAAWAQNLTFERHRILQALNVGRSSPITDIRFSTRDWWKGEEKIPSQAAQQQGMWQEHPSRLTDAIASDVTEEDAASVDPQAAFHRWAQRLQQRSQTLPLCPQCSCPTPPGELDRWSVCALCAAKQWDGDRTSFISEDS